MELDKDLPKAGVLLLIFCIAGGGGYLLFPTEFDNGINWINDFFAGLIGEGVGEENGGVNGGAGPGGTTDDTPGSGGGGGGDATTTISDGTTTTTDETTTSADGTTTSLDGEETTTIYGDGELLCWAVYVDEEGEPTEEWSQPLWCWFWDGLPLCMPPEEMVDGHWDCMGACLDDAQEIDENLICVLNPVEEIPAEGFTDPSGPIPDCVCLEKMPGECNWYDSNYGEGVDNIECGGFCPGSAICTAILKDEIAICDCFEEEINEECRWRLEENNEILYEYEDWFCEGNCPDGMKCEIVMYGDTKIEDCTCTGEYIPEDDECGWHEDEQGYLECYGICDDELECKNWDKDECECVDPQTGMPPQIPCSEVPAEKGVCDFGYCEGEGECIYVYDYGTEGHEQCVCLDEQGIQCKDLKDPFLCDLGYCDNTVDVCVNNGGICDCLYDEGQHDCITWACDGAGKSYCSDSTFCNSGFFHQQIGDKYCGTGWCCCDEFVGV